MVAISVDDAAEPKLDLKGLSKGGHLGEWKSTANGIFLSHIAHWNLSPISSPFCRQWARSGSPIWASHRLLRLLLWTLLSKSHIFIRNMEKVKVIDAPENISDVAVCVASNRPCLIKAFSSTPRMRASNSSVAPKPMSAMQRWSAAYLKDHTQPEAEVAVRPNLLISSWQPDTIVQQAVTHSLFYTVW
jgi:hypothetical protein